MSVTRDFLQSEIENLRRQRAAAETMMLRAQSTVAMADGAIQAYQALLDRIEDAEAPPAAPEIEIRGLVPMPKLNGKAEATTAD